MKLPGWFWDVMVGRVRQCCGERPPTCRCGLPVWVIDNGPLYTGLPEHLTDPRIYEGLTIPRKIDDG